jgi:hypothetical protein
MPFNAWVRRGKKHGTKTRKSYTCSHPAAKNDWCLPLRQDPVRRSEMPERNLSGDLLALYSSRFRSSKNKSKFRLPQIGANQIDTLRSEIPNNSNKGSKTVRISAIQLGAKALF